ncbi:phage terminase large subunit family protein [Paraburkholderia sp. UCT2]|uniref:phage terminase large subunit family protein n=1 Tax=Paraburkholderia sp. UCT2 TaxID=2615208 RepID=UPI001655C776|nr:terminase gpA endonuclease subunit [Paraburkholderia sp. UCT2]MBC8729429.1 terminase [Paraburkholderia sp. UCT2]
MSISSLPTSGSLNRASTRNKADDLRRVGRSGWTPPPRLSVPQWADQYRRLAKESGSLSGRWSTGTVEAARGPMLAVTEPGVHVITAMVNTQLFKTSLIENVFGYFAHLDPCPMLLLEPKEAAAEQFSKERITPLVRVTPVLRERVGTTKTRNAEETLLFKSFPGGFLALAGAGSPDNLARRPIRLVLADEIDKYPVTREGDPIALAEERVATFANWLSVRTCSPTVTEESRIEASYGESDQRRASVACPHCGHRQFLEFFRHVEWEKRKDDKGNVTAHRTKTARVYCESCGAGWSESERLTALQTVRWHQTRVFECCGARHVPLDAYDRAWRNSDEARDGADPASVVWDWWASERHAVYRAKCPTCGAWSVDNTHAGFQASKLLSPWTRDRPADIAARWIDAQGDEERLQAWWNTQMGLPYRPRTGRSLSAEAVVARGEIWAAEVPDGVAVLVVGVDVQDYRVELEVVGWGRNEESWSIDYEIIEGEFSDARTQARIDTYLKRLWYRADGRPFEIMSACIDSGGHHTQAVYQFCAARIGRRIWAVKGESARGGERNPVWPSKRPTSRTKKTYRPILLGVNAAKDTIRQRLLLDTPGPGYMHFPADRDIGYYAQLTAERIVIKESGGRRYRVWELPPGRANEALDCRVYAYGALCGLLFFGLQLNRRADAVQAWTPPPDVPPTPHRPYPATARMRTSLVQRLA